MINVFMAETCTSSLNLQMPGPEFDRQMVGWHSRLNGHESEPTPGDGEGQGSLACCSPWRRKKSDPTDRLNNNKTCEKRFVEWEHRPGKHQGKIPRARSQMAFRSRLQSALPKGYLLSQTKRMWSVILLFSTSLLP